MRVTVMRESNRGAAAVRRRRRASYDRGVAELTTSSMHDARDAEDRRLLDAGELSLLVESYYGVMAWRKPTQIRLPSSSQGW
jgi:hypothetical protein